MRESEIGGGSPALADTGALHPLETSRRTGLVPNSITAGGEKVEISMASQFDVFFGWIIDGEQGEDLKVEHLSEQIPRILNANVYMTAGKPLLY